MQAIRGYTVIYKLLNWFVRADAPIQANKPVSVGHTLI